MREIVKAFLKAGSGTGGSLLLGMIAMKVMAVILGPSGIGLYSLLRQIADFSNRLGSTGGGRAALVQGLASRKGQVRDDYLVTTFWVFVLGTLLLVGVLVVSAPWIALWALDSNDAQTTNVVRGLALPVALTSALAYLTGVLNGFRAIGLLALLQVLGATAMALLAYPISRMVEAGHPMAFIGILSVSPAVGVALGTRAALRAGWLSPLLRSFRIRFHSDSLRHFFSFAGTLLIADLVSAGTVLVVRSLIVHYDGLSSAGIFAAAWTLSMTYVMLILGSFGTYYLPVLSQTDDPLDRVVLIQRLMRLATLLTVPLVTSVVVLKPLVVEIIYSSEFMNSLEIVRWMLIGDYFKIAGWVVAMPMLAYAHMKVYIWGQALWHAGFLVFVVLGLVSFSNVQVLGVGFLLMYVVLLLYCLRYARDQYHFPLTRGMVGPWLVGLALIIGVSWHTWSDTHVNWVATPLWIGAAVSYSWLSLTRNERREMLRMPLRWRETRQ